MAAPSIPNLLSSRATGRPGGRGGRGRRQPPPSTGPSPDAAIQGTDTDAAVSRLSAVDQGYLEDPYARYFVTGPPTRRLPIINRGTYMRTRALDAMINAFLSHNGSSLKQVISLGAGTDTRPLHMLQRPGAQNLVYHEIDFETTCRRKLAITQSSPGLCRIFKDIIIHQGGSWSAEPPQGGEYHCHAFDLRNISKAMTQLPSHVRSDVPTLLLSECCLCYLTQRDSETVLHFFSSKIDSIAALLYEPMPLHDAFGDMMVSNLEARHIHMPSLQAYRDHHGQLARLRDSGFDSLGYATIGNTWNEWVDSKERERVDGLEGLDEVEEWNLLAAHYVVVWGARGGAAFGPLQKFWAMGTNP
ncbi:Leucine carboxyl methyltransferase superfamily [Metarhizium album ARSEF 1941]|uniref:Leucine carboxyl methyltransferase 1 n=1 Tax=Metarhizium album (strain ARSEF 1941) TaxID=1081103 RepID=A0A0B2WWY4_METAS|nr:Leucine carboxyl methyltransferase superfamily [Metarhizium album ARSEF 1941]KHN98109.1 Leucine carboxyl methyltransferase superfamily [Metarhizium album ARSEF 1941]